MLPSTKRDLPPSGSVLRRDPLTGKIEGNPILTRPMAAHRLSNYVGDFNDFTTALTTLAEYASERLTLPQLAFFITAGTADIKGHAATFSDIRDTLGESLNKSLHTTYKVFMAQARKRSDTKVRNPGLGWLTTEVDPEDNRRKYIHLTPTGRLVMTKLAQALTGDQLD